MWGFSRCSRRRDRGCHLSARLHGAQPASTGRIRGKKEVCGFWEAGCCRFPGWNLEVRSWGSCSAGLKTTRGRASSEPSSEPLIFLMLSLIPVLGCSAQAHLGSAAGPVPQPCWLPELGQTPLSEPGGCSLLQTHLTQLWRSCAGSTEHAAPGSLVSHCGWSSRGLPLLGAVGALLHGVWSVPWLTKPVVGVTPGEGTPEHGEVTQFRASLAPFYPGPALPLGPPHPRCWRCLRG